MNSVLVSVGRIVGGVAVISAVLVAGWFAVGVFVGIAIKGAQLVMG